MGKPPTSPLLAVRPAKPTHNKLQDGDQTRYIPPTLSQSLTASAKLAVDGIMHEPLTAENLVKNTAPLAKDLGEVAKGAVISGAGWAGETLVRIGAAAVSSKAGEAVSRYIGASDTVPQSSAAKSSTNVASFEPPSNAFASKTKSQPTLSDIEEMAIANAIADGTLKPGDKGSGAVKAFLKRFRQEQAVLEWKAKQETGKRDARDSEGGLRWEVDTDGGYDPLGVSGTYKRPPIDVHDAHVRKELRKQ